jgi:cobyrinic acid a,c-diamide synthase
MLGAVKAVASFGASAARATPVELTLANDCWLAPRGTQVRGYQNSRWQFEPTAEMTRLIAEQAHAHDLLQSRGVVGSRVHLNFATQPEFLRSFFLPQSARRPLARSAAAM